MQIKTKQKPPKKTGIMTEREFADLTGKDITSENFMDEYTTANRIYMAAGCIDKQTFCKDYRKSGATATLCALTEKVESQSSYLTKQHSTMTSVAHALIDSLLVIEEAAIASTIYARAIELIGLKECVKYKLEKNYPLMERDRNLLLKGMDSIPYNF